MASNIHLWAGQGMPPGHPWIGQIVPGDVHWWSTPDPDLNSIEHLWPWVVRDLQGRIFTDCNTLWEAIKASFASIPAAFVQNLYKSKARRLEAVIEAKGGHTKY